jgi:glycine/D-amino acid oxidase-like deaminating enzyme
MVRLNDSNDYEVVIVGAGQAGLALGHYLAGQGRKFGILERADDVASAWSARWDSLRLFTPRRYDGLPGLDFPGDPDGYPTRDEVVAYLQSYAAHFHLPVRLGTAAVGLSRDGDELVIELEGGRITARQAVLATGPFQEPRTPEFADGLAPEVTQMHSTGYRRPADLPAGRTLSRIKHRRGVTDIPGLYTLGLQWQHTRGSALLGFVKDDATYVADQIAARAAVAHEVASTRPQSTEQLAVQKGD